MGTYLSDAQIRAATRELTIIFALPYSSDLFGTAWELVLAEVKGGVWTRKRDNRPNPDIYVEVDGNRTNYSVKCEKLKADSTRTCAASFLGKTMDFIIARPKVDQIAGKKLCSRNRASTPSTTSAPVLLDTAARKPTFRASVASSADISCTVRSSIDTRGCLTEICRAA